MGVLSLDPLRLPTHRHDCLLTPAAGLAFRTFSAPPGSHESLRLTVSPSVSIREQRSLSWDPLCHPTLSGLSAVRLWLLGLSLAAENRKFAPGLEKTGRLCWVIDCFNEQKILV